MKKKTKSNLHSVKAEIEVRNNCLSLKDSDNIPSLVRHELEKSIEELNRLVRDGALNIENIDMSPIDFNAVDDDLSRDVPCNANRISTHWWGIKVHLSRDLLMDVGLGNVPVSGIAAVFFGGTAAIIVGTFVFAYILALSAACGPCGVQADITWVGVPKKIKSRK